MAVVGFEPTTLRRGSPKTPAFAHGRHDNLLTPLLSLHSPSAISVVTGWFLYLVLTYASVQLSNSSLSEIALYPAATTKQSIKQDLDKIKLPHIPDLCKEPNKTN